MAVYLIEDYSEELTTKEVKNLLKQDLDNLFLLLEKEGFIETRTTNVNNGYRVTKEIPGRGASGYFFNAFTIPGLTVTAQRNLKEVLIDWYRDTLKKYDIEPSDFDYISVEYPYVKDYYGDEYYDEDDAYLDITLLVKGLTNKD